MSEKEENTNIYREALRKYWGFDSFRPLQEEIVLSAGEGRDTLALMPTGGGKSITFQVPAMAKDGICLVITPLIALMKDQVENLKKKGIKALAIHSGLTRDEISAALDNCIFGDYKFLYLSPERLATQVFRIRVQEMNVNLIAVDEAHCISQWGYDFRPSYLRISALRELLPGVPVLALTATATPAVADDIMDRLAFRDGKLLKKSFERKNLVYVVRNTEDKPRELLKIVEGIPGAGVVYVRNRRKTRELSDYLVSNGYSADYYHAGLKFEDRMRKQDDWQQDRTRIMVSTNAFGMGIDKPDVRFVVHMDLPDSPEAYFQEAGRAGRDEKKAWAVLLFSPADQRTALKRIETSYPTIGVLKEIYSALFNFLQVPIGGGKGTSHDFILSEFLHRYKYDVITASNALKLLGMEGYFEITEEINNPSRVKFITGRDELYRFQAVNPGSDDFIKLLLRSYTGLFSQYVAIDEHTLSIRSGLTHDEVYKILVKLSTAKIIQYIPKKQNPVISLLEERLDEKNLFIDRKKYMFRKERYEDRINALLEYATTDSKCRSKYLLAYFGERNAPRCRQCDVCLDRKSAKLPDAVAKERTQIILSMIQEQPLHVDEIIEGSDLDEQEVADLLEFLLEKGKIRRREDLKYETRRK